MMRSWGGMILLAASWAAMAQPKPSQTQKPREYVTAAASRDTAPRVGLIPSTFAGGEELDGRKIRSLAKPAPIDAAITGAQLNDMLRLAVELGGGRRGGLVTAIGREDWVVVKIDVRACPGDAQYHAGMVTDPRLVDGVLRYLAERGLGRRFSVVEGAPCGGGTAGLWESTWKGDFDGVSYRSSVDALARQYPALRFELIDLTSAPSLEMPVEGRVFASRNKKGVYRVPRLLRECDKVIAIAPLAPRAAGSSRIALSMLSYLGFWPGAPVADLGEAGEVAVDLFSFHPADYAILGGTHAAEAGEGGHTRLRRHNLLIAGTNAPAVDSVGAAVMGFDSESIRHLALAVQHGYGINDAYSIWTRGTEIEEVKPKKEWARFP